MCVRSKQQNETCNHKSYCCIAMLMLIGTCYKYYSKNDDTIRMQNNSCSRSDAQTSSEDIILVIVEVLQIDMTQPEAVIIKTLVIETDSSVRGSGRKMLRRQPVNCNTLHFGTESPYRIPHRLVSCRPVDIFFLFCYHCYYYFLVILVQIFIFLHL
jgi:hypothetical protein